MQKPRAPKRITYGAYESYVEAVALYIAVRDNHTEHQWDVELASEDALSNVASLYEIDWSKWTQKHWRLAVALFEGQVDSKYQL
jgi:hypothetical protein